MGEGAEKLLLHIGLAASISNSFGFEKVPELGQKKKMGRAKKHTKSQL